MPRRAPGRRVWRWRAVATVCLAAALAVACSTTTSHRVLSIFFDGVPEPGAKRAAAPASGAAAGDVAVASPTSFAHGPYADRQCDACHDQRANNALVAPREALCQRCHDLALDRAYVHGPIASGGCLVCHDPHTSRYRYLLVAESGTFCLRCHDAASVAANPVHAGVEGGCTDCHDAHMSDQKYLLR